MLTKKMIKDRRRCSNWQEETIGNGPVSKTDCVILMKPSNILRLHFVINRTIKSRSVQISDLLNTQSINTYCYLANLRLFPKDPGSSTGSVLLFLLRFSVVFPSPSRQIPDITPNQTKPNQTNNHFIPYFFYYLLTMNSLQDHVASASDSVIKQSKRTQILPISCIMFHIRQRRMDV
jgi:hypothetical protein